MLQKCATGSIIGLWQGENDGDASHDLIIYIKDSSGVRKAYHLNKVRNLDDASGKALFALLLHAYTTGEEVIIGDDKYTRCDDINSVFIGRKR